VSRRAAYEKKMSSATVVDAEAMISGYEREIAEYKHRVQLMEKKEIERLAKESEYREELAGNHGKPKAFFQVPKLTTKTRSNNRRLSKLLYHQ